MNFLIADSGSTKTDWRFINERGTRISFETEGLNPYYHSTESIRWIVQKEMDRHSKINRVGSVHFYGSGCTDKRKNEIVAQALRYIFGENLHVEVNSDLLGAAHAICGSDPGIACILGTGSNSCVYDGRAIVDHIPPLGFMLGDEGSGAQIGKKIIQSYFYREMPAELKNELENRYDMSRSIVLDHIYNKRHANRYVAGFSLFAGDFKDHEFIKQLIKDSFSEFIDRQISHYDLSAQYEIGFTGSIAFVFKDLLEEVFREKSLKLGKVIRKPMDELVHYHLQKRINK